MQSPYSIEPLSVGVVGLGEMGQLHARAIQRSSFAQLRAVADPDQALLAPFESQQVRSFGSAHDLFADSKIDTVSLCLPHHLHAPLGLAAIAAGKNVIIEKPLAMTLDESKQLVDAAAIAGVILGVSHNQLFYSAHVEAKRMIESGELGRPVFLRMRLGMGPTFGGWRTSVAHTGGGLLMDAGVHRLYLAQHLFGPVTSSHSFLDATRVEGETFAVVVLEFASGARGVIEANHFGPSGFFEDEIEVVGTEAVLRLPGLESDLAAHDSITVFRDGVWSSVSIADDTWESTVFKSVEGYMAAAAAGDGVPTSGSDALETMRLLEEIYQRAAILDVEAAAR